MPQPDHWLLCPPPASSTGSPLLPKSLHSTKSEKQAYNPQTGDDVYPGRQKGEEKKEGSGKILARKGERGQRDDPFRVSCCLCHKLK